MATVGPDQAGLDSYVDPGDASMGGSVAGVKVWTTHPLPYPVGVFIAHKLLYGLHSPPLRARTVG